MTISIDIVRIVALFIIVIGYVRVSSEHLHKGTDALKKEPGQYSIALNVAEDALSDAEKLFADFSFERLRGWKRVGKHSAFSIHSKSTVDRNITVASMILGGSTDDIKREVWDRIESLPSWNSIVNSSHIVSTLNDHSDVFHFITNDVLMVTGRELLTARTFKRTDDGYLIVFRSIDLPEIPERKDKVRADLHLAALRIRRDPSNQKKTLCDLAIDVDLRGDLPKDIIKSAMPPILSIVAELMVKHFKDNSGGTSGHF